LVASVDLEDLADSVDLEASAEAVSEADWEALVEADLEEADLEEADLEDEAVGDKKSNHALT
jgi:uncharacterized protein YjbI with pentapeptide repeats